MFARSTYSSASARLRRGAFTVAAALVVATALIGCDEDKDKDLTAETIADHAAALIEEHDKHAITWVVNEKGTVRALVKDDAGEPVEEVKGELTVKPLQTGAEKEEHELEVDDGVLAADIGELETDLTEMRYSLKADGKRLRGVIHVPKGGTAQLAESAKIAKKADVGAKGPHGGVVQVVGEDVVEVVAHKKTQEVRAYVLDDQMKPVSVGERKMKLGFVGDEVEVVTLEPDDEKAYFTGELSLKHDPVKITVVVEHDDETHVALCGYHPGEVVVVHDRAPHHVILVVDDWDHHHGVHVRHHHKGKYKGKGKGKHKVHIKHHGGKGHKVKVKIH